MKFEPTALGVCDGCGREKTEPIGRHLCRTHGGEFCEWCWKVHEGTLHQTAPEPGAIVLCLACALEKPWGTWHPHGVALCVDCRDAAYAANLNRASRSGASK